MKQKIIGNKIVSFQFIVCGCLQVMVDFAILGQVFLYRENTSKRKKSEGNHLNCWLKVEKENDKNDKVAENDPEESEELLPETESNEIKMSVDCDRSLV